MRSKSFFLLTLFVSLFAACSEKSSNSSSVSIQTIVYKPALSPYEVKEVVCFLHDLHSRDGAMSVIFEDWWIHQHCTARMQHKLIEAYDYDLEPGQVAYGSWIIGGWDAGEDGATIYQNVTFDDDYFYVHLAPSPESGFYKGKRVIRYKMIYENGAPIIDDCERIADFQIVE